MKRLFEEKAFLIVENIFSNNEVARLLQLIDAADSSGASFRKTDDLFAIRQFFKAIPEAASLVLNEKLTQIIAQNFGEEFFIVKSIYFDKPHSSNWFVSYHQDITISVDKKMEIEGFQSWTVKQNQFAVQPPLTYLEDNFTIRIHLDDTTKENGALKVIPGSHLKGIDRAEEINRDMDYETDCEVPAGGVMFMKPLLMHASGRTTNRKQRRVIHVELSRKALPDGLNWAEYMPINFFTP